MSGSRTWSTAGSTGSAGPGVTPAVGTSAAGGCPSLAGCTLTRCPDTPPGTSPSEWPPQDHTTRSRPLGCDSPRPAQTALLSQLAQAPVPGDGSQFWGAKGLPMLGGPAPWQPGAYCSEPRGGALRRPGVEEDLLGRRIGRLGTERGFATGGAVEQSGTLGNAGGQEEGWRLRRTTEDEARARHPVVGLGSSSVNVRSTSRSGHGAGSQNGSYGPTTPCRSSECYQEC